MRWCRFSTGEKVAYGIVEDDQVLEVSGSPFEGYERLDISHSLDSVKLLVPCTPPSLYAAGVNYAGHARWATASVGLKQGVPDKPYIRWRGVNAVVAHEDNIVIPKDSSGVVQYEGELAAVIGKKGKHISKEDALTHVLGYTIANDVSERSWQQEDRTLWRAKNTDTFKPLGPWIVTGLDPNELQAAIRLNGREVSKFNVGDMVFDTATYIAEVSKYITLYPGDVIEMGTEGGSEDMRPGDVIEIEITGIGTLRNYAVAEE